MNQLSPTSGAGHSGPPLAAPTSGAGHSGPPSSSVPPTSPGAGYSRTPSSSVPPTSPGAGHSRAPSSSSRPSRPSRSNPGQPRTPGWSDRQRIVFLRACSAAGFNDQQRYILMRHVGCRSDGKSGRPSVKHPRNTNTMFVQAMAIAESQAAQRGKPVGPPREFRSWREAADSGRSQLVAKARCIINEARQRMPGEFNEGLEGYIVAHTTGDDDAELVMVKPASLDEVDGGQAHRVVEALRAWVGRRFHAACINPRTFEIPPGARRRASLPSGAGHSRAPSVSSPTPSGAGHSRAPSVSSPTPSGAGHSRAPSVSSTTSSGAGHSRAPSNPPHSQASPLKPQDPPPAA